MQRSVWRFILFGGTLLLTTAAVLTVRWAEERASRPSLEALRRAAPLLALASQAPQVRAAVLGDPGTAAALDEIFFVEPGRRCPEEDANCDLIVIARAPHYRTAAARRSLLEWIVAPLLARDGTAVVPREWTADAHFPCRKTAVPGTGGAYFFLTPLGQPTPELAELSRRLKFRRQGSGLPPYPEGVLEAYFGDPSTAAALPEQAVPSLPALPYRWAAGGVLLLLLGLHVFLSERGPETADCCYAAEDGLAAALLLAGAGAAGASQQARWGVDPLWLLPLTACFFLGFGEERVSGRRTGWLTAALLAAAGVSLYFYDMARWCGALLALAAALGLAGAGRGGGRRVLPPLLSGTVLGGGAACLLLYCGTPPWLLLALSVGMKIPFLLRI